MLQLNACMVAVQVHVQITNAELVNLVEHASSASLEDVPDVAGLMQDFPEVLVDEGLQDFIDGF